MLSGIREIFEGLEEKHKALLQQLDAMSADTICFKAGAGKWSIDTLLPAPWTWRKPCVLSMYI